MAETIRAGLTTIDGDEKSETLPLSSTIHVHQCTGARISREESHLVSLLGAPDARFVRDIVIHMSFQDREIECDTCLKVPRKIAVARVSPKVSPGVQVMFTMSKE
jgi:hypothetical protein